MEIFTRNRFITLLLAAMCFCGTALPCSSAAPAPADARIPECVRGLQITKNYEAALTAARSYATDKLKKRTDSVLAKAMEGKDYIKADQCKKLQEEVLAETADMNWATIERAEMTPANFMAGKVWQDATGHKLQLQDGYLINPANGVKTKAKVINYDIVESVETKEIYVWCGNNAAAVIPTSCFPINDQKVPCYTAIEEGKARSGDQGDKMKQALLSQYKADANAHLAATKARATYISGLRAHMDKLAKSGKLEEAAAVQKHLQELESLPRSEAPAKNGPPQEKAPRFTGTHYEYLENGQLGDCKAVFSGNKVEFLGKAGKSWGVGKWIGTSPGKHIHIYKTDQAEYLIFRYKNYILRVWQWGDERTQRLFRLHKK